DHDISRLVNIPRRVGSELRAVEFLDALDFFVLTHIDFAGFNHAPIVFQCLMPGGFLAFTDQRQPADLEQFGCCKKHHLGWKAEYRFGRAPFSQSPAVNPSLPCLYCSREPGWPRSDNNDIEYVQSSRYRPSATTFAVAVNFKRPFSSHSTSSLP